MIPVKDEPPKFQPRTNSNPAIPSSSSSSSSSSASSEIVKQEGIEQLKESQKTVLLHYHFVIIIVFLFLLLLQITDTLQKVRIKTEKSMFIISFCC